MEPTTYSDPDGYQDIGLSFFLLSRRLHPDHFGLMAAYHQPSNVLWLRGGGFCVPGQAQSRSTDYVTVDCANTTVSGADDTLTINWRVRPEQCFSGGCGRNLAYGYVSDSDAQSDAGVMGIWTLDPASAPARRTRPLVMPTQTDLKRLREEIEAWQSQIIAPRSVRGRG